MARYLVRVRSPKSPAEAFDCMTNLANLAEWDPGVTKVEQSAGNGPGASAVYDVTIRVSARRFGIARRGTSRRRRSSCAPRAAS
jgi:hypothetical protein